jgi:hypothetical protein
LTVHGASRVIGAVQPPHLRDDDAPPSSMNPTERAQLLLSQQMLEAQLEIARSARYQRQSRRGRRVWLILLFGVSGLVAYVVNERNGSPALAILAPAGTMLLFAIVWTYKKPH